MPVNAQQGDHPMQNDQPLQVSEPKTRRINPSDISDINVPRAKYEDFKHVLKDPEGTLRKNAAIAVANYGSHEAHQARVELRHLDNAILQGYIGGSMWSDEARKLGRLKEEVLWKPLEERGLVQNFPVPILEPISEGGEPE